jgi:hypothetical protein
VIAKVCERGQDVAGLIYYLFRASPTHESPRFVAGFDEPDRLGVVAAATPVLHGPTPLGDSASSVTGEAGDSASAGEQRPDLAEVIRQLQQPVKAAGMRPSDMPVYHVVLATKQDTGDGEVPDRVLTDAEYRKVAEDALTSVGLINDAKGRADVRWVAVRHDDHHVHVVVTMAREDGTRAYVGNDFWKLGKVARDAEKRLGLVRTGQRDSTAVKRPTRAENELAQREGWSEPTRVKLRREVQVAAAGAADLDGFFEQLQSAGLMVKHRYSTTNIGQVTGYSVADPTRLDKDQQPIYFSGGSLAADLTLPKLRHRFVDPRGTTEDSTTPPAATPRAAHQRRTPVDREQLWQQSLSAARSAAEEIREFASTDPTRAADAAWAAADFLRATSRMVEGRRGGALSEAAEHYDRAAREAWARPPAPTRAGQGLRQAASLMLAAQLLRGNETKQLLLLLAQLAVLTDAVVRLREEQDRRTQASAARRAAEQLRDEHRSRAEALERLQAGDPARSTGPRRSRDWLVDNSEERAPSSGTPGRPASPPRSR